MTKKLLKQMVQESFSKNGELLEDIVLTIAEKLNRINLKKYIFALKTSETRQMVIIKTSNNLSEIQKKEFKALYTNKRITYEVNPSLLLGIEIIDNDMVYNMNLKTKLENLQSFIQN